MFDAIVVPLDGTDQTKVAARPAVALAAQTHVPLAFVSVARPDHVEERRYYLEGVARPTFLPASVEVLSKGDVASGIVATAAAHAPALVCMASHGRGALAQALFGTVATDVVRRLGGPVLLAGPYCADVMRYSEVIVALDESDESAAIVPAAVALAERIDAKMQVVQVIDPRDLARATAAGVDPSDVRESGHVARVAARLTADGIAADWEVLHDTDAARGLLDYLRDYPTAILAMATHARSGLSLLAEGSVATQVVQLSTNPVLVVHP